jgi:tRNA pseudouridine38-40 synthase
VFERISRVSDDVQDGFVRVRLDLSYDGRDFSGWAKQAQGRRTVQGDIEDALRTVTRSKETYEKKKTKHKKKK